MKGRMTVQNTCIASRFGLLAFTKTKEKDCFMMTMTGITIPMKVQYAETIIVYSKTCLKQRLKNRQNKGLKDKWLLNEGLGAFWCTFDLH